MASSKGYYKISQWCSKDSADTLLAKCLDDPVIPNMRAIRAAAQRISYEVSIGLIIISAKAMSAQEQMQGHC